MVMVPSSGVSTPVIILIVVVFPAPFGPIKPNSSPPSTWRVRLSTAFLLFFAYVLVTCCKSIICSSLPETGISCLSDSLHFTTFRCL